QLLLAADMVIGPVDELVVLAGDDERELDDVLSAISQRFLPNRVVACRNKKSPAPASPALDGIFQGREAINGQTTLYICRQFACQAPEVGWDAIAQAINRL